MTHTRRRRAALVLLVLFALANLLASSVAAFRHDWPQATFYLVWFLIAYTLMDEVRA